MISNLISTYNYSLPAKLVADKPPIKRDCSKLLTYNIKSEKKIDKKFHDLVDILEPNDVLIFNNTKVIPARINLYKETGGQIEILFNREIKKNVVEVLYGSSRVPKINSFLLLNNIKLFKVIKIYDKYLLLELINYMNVLSVFEKFGETPLPKYIKRPATSDDKDKYQTVYATNDGSVAAPTAGLHFSISMIDELKDKGVIIKFLTLHISYNTFKPITVESYLDHDIGREYFNIDESIFKEIDRAKRSGKRIIAVGTTTARALEYCYHTNINRSYKGSTGLFIYPGHNFKSINCLITNFHLPQSSLLLLVSAFADWGTILKLYNYAITKNYMFYSYGDSMFLENII